VSAGAGPDLRLAGFAVAIWLSSLTSLYLPSGPGTVMGAAALVAGGVFAVIPACRGPWWTARRPAITRARWLAVAILLGVGAGAVATGVRVGVREAEPLAALVREGRGVRVDAVVRDDPRAVSGSPGMPVTYLVAVDLHRIAADDAAPMRLSVRALVLGSDPAWRSLLPGQRVTANGKLLAPRGGDLRAAVVSVRQAPTLVGRAPWS
jgi:competence protein ComEC